MKFRRLRLSGFKSFVEPVELEIEQGLTGVVGPNGCGKSNLLEALRWVMGESSHKSMRASGMDDVIFSGTATRPARNLAEVLVTIDNADRRAPTGFNDSDHIEVARRIDRDRGSTYRINGREARARDVQLLFADASTGARSPALVKQGQIGEIINAKPQSRRRILEEAAGITGLYSRRHDAELKLKAAEDNLLRLEDVIGQLAQQLAALKRQSRQAVKYKELSAGIRRLEAIGLFAGWAQALSIVETEQVALDGVVRVLAESTRMVSELTRRHGEEKAALPALREAEAVRAAALRRLQAERDAIDREDSEARQRRQELELRRSEAEADLARESELSQDAAQSLEKLDGEHRELTAALASDTERQAASEHLKTVQDTLARSQAEADRAASALAGHRAQGDALARRSRELSDRMARLQAELQSIERRRAEMTGEDSAGDDKAPLTALLGSALTRAMAAERLTLAAEAEVRTRRAAEAEARSSYEQQQRGADRLATEMATLAKLLNVAGQLSGLSLVDSMTVEPGYEVAVAAALGDEIEAPADETSPAHWRVLGPLASPPLPAGTTPLSHLVQAPAALERRLSHTGLVSREEGAQAQRRLAPGQRLVSPQGDLWRWDGFCAAADAPTAAARRLSERNRFGALTEAADQARAAAEGRRGEFDATRAAAELAMREERQRRDEWREAAKGLEELQRAVTIEQKAAAKRQSEASALAEAGRRVAAELHEAEAVRRLAHAETAALPDLTELETSLTALRETLNGERGAYAEARAHGDRLEGEARRQQNRLKAIAGERAEWQARAYRAGDKIAALTSRGEELRAEIAALAERPHRIAERRQALLSLIGEAERELATASDQLIAGDNALRAIEGELRAAQEGLSAAREEQARRGARLEAAEERRQSLIRRIEEGPGIAPADLPRLHEFDPADLPDTTALDLQLFTLKDQRERLGGVNLMAEEEAGEVDRQLESITRERDDVLNAIHRLRQGISSLNREGRERLIGAFGAVNDHFGALFTTLFGGGRAELQLIESEDPLEAGLEILAHPPGKRPQVLSLLSGGEQALTALALIFAVFLTNPSPICVLDEVDAPLDDHNVERFCKLLNAMLERAETRFLVITHHPVTMARMHRLFGVTMMERGVSQLVSVDLQTAEGLRQAS